MNKKLGITVIMILITVCTAFALDNASATANKTDSYTILLGDGTPIKFSETHEIEKATVFWLGYEQILQGEKPGGIYVFDEYSKNFRGYSTPATPSDFYKKPNSQNAAVMMLIPADVLALMFKSLQDTSTVTYLSDFGNEPMLCAVVYRVPSDYVFEDSVHYFVGKVIDSTIVSFGYDPDVFYQTSVEMGMDDREALIARGINGESVTAMLNEIRTAIWRSNEKVIKDSAQHRRYFVFGIVGLSFIFIVLVAILSHSAKKDAEKYHSDDSDI